MIKNKETLSISEIQPYLKEKGKEREKAKGFVKKFAKLSEKDAKEMRKKLEQLDLMKMKSEQIVKVIDLLPSDAEELNKIFISVSLDDDETNKILNTVKEYK